MREAADWAAGSLGYRFQDPDLLRQALTHRSASSRHNERLEFLGDAVLGFVIAEALYAQRADATEGTMSRLRARIVRGETLEEVARELDLGALVVLGGGELRSGGHQRGSILANALEAVFGAVFLDGGLTAARGVIERLLQPRLEALPSDEELRDPKTRLQEYLQGRGLPLPVYEVKGQTGAAHEQIFAVICRLEAVGLTAEGAGPSRRAAEQQAAEMALGKIADVR